ncbi:hypothetical protein C1631_022785 [Chryseobacterium phosphatilyticum]|uniref:Uncharacterized protein n=1 Tax=Chryseobacterium phosphatilyticum TaxID=475075 RepID=A0A316WLU6_9FLAO|nr:hypothetical protein [Chryseobacterium phosphatilyticum]PWN62394.1 hypothetical protein C1631_022785 [Chryseobacterium phosphatilyticum]
MKVETQERIRKIREKNFKSAVTMLFGFIIAILNIVYSPKFMSTQLVWVIEIILIFIVLYSFNKLLQADTAIKNIIREDFATENKISSQFNSKLPKDIQLKIAENVEDLINSMQDEIDDLQKNNNELLEYHDLFRSYYNEDWDRNNPFAEQIEFSNRFLRYREILPLSIKIKDLNLKAEDKNEFDLIFFNNFDIKELPLGIFIMFMCDLKGFKADNPEDNQVPGAFYEHQLNIYTKQYVSKI